MTKVLSDSCTIVYTDSPGGGGCDHTELFKRETLRDSAIVLNNIWPTSLYVRFVLICKRIFWVIVKRLC